MCTCTLALLFPLSPFPFFETRVLSLFLRRSIREMGRQRISCRVRTAVDIYCLAAPSKSGIGSGYNAVSVSTTACSATARRYSIVFDYRFSLRAWTPIVLHSYRPTFAIRYSAAPSISYRGEPRSRISSIHCWKSFESRATCRLSWGTHALGSVPNRGQRQYHWPLRTYPRADEESPVAFR